MKSFAALVLLACTLPGVSQAFDNRVAFREAADFSETAIVRGVRATQEQCKRIATAVLIPAKGDEGECLRYWKAGFEGETATRAVVFFHGDVFVGAGKTSKNYLEMDTEWLQSDAERWAKKLGTPYIFFARPGTHGSSGDHMQRRRIEESRLISAALDQIKVRYGIKELVLAGQSGGGHVTASLLTMRSDIVCAIPTSAPSSPRVRWISYGRNKDTTGYADSYEPTEHLDKEKVNKHLRVFVLGNPDDKNVVWPSQIVLADKLKELGIPVQVLHGEGTGPDRHGLSHSSRIVAGWCAKDFSDERILDKAAKGLKG